MLISQVFLGLPIRTGGEKNEASEVKKKKADGKFQPMSNYTSTALPHIAVMAPVLH